MEAFLYTGWFTERLAREERLQGPHHYIGEMLDGAGVSAATQRAMAEAELTRMAMGWGLEVEDIEEDQDEA